MLNKTPLYRGVFIVFFINFATVVAATVVAFLFLLIIKYLIRNEILRKKKRIRIPF